MGILRPLFLMVLWVTPVSAVELPKCRNLAGYELKQVCEAHNQRAQWQVEETARRVTIGLEAILIKHAEADSDGILAMLKNYLDGAVETISNIF